jgi:hypothetical protein
MPATIQRAGARFSESQFQLPSRPSRSKDDLRRCVRLTDATKLSPCGGERRLPAVVDRRYSKAGPVGTGTQKRIRGKHPKGIRGKLGIPHYKG